MRITNSLQYQFLTTDIQSSLGDLNTVQQEIASGKKINTFSDDAAGAAQSLVYRSALGDNAQYQRDATSATAFLTATDGALSDANSILQSTRQIAVQGASSTQTTASFAALSSEVDGAISQLTQIANSKSGNRYLFGGTNTTTAPYDATQTYQGNAQVINAVIGPNYSVQINTVGSTTFDPAFTALNSLKTDLGTGDVTAISGDIAKFDTALSAVGASQAVVGTTSDAVTAATTQLTRAQGEYQDSISNIEDVDLSQAYVQLQSATNIYQASLDTASKAYQYSLADYMPAS